MRDARCFSQTVVCCDLEDFADGNGSDWIWLKDRELCSRGEIISSI